jgi:anti-anti-sigma factor
MNVELTIPMDAGVIAACNVTELVRGNDHELVARLAPQVRERSVALDLAKVERIDAAGIAALISLYGCARDAGHSFSVLNLRPRVAEILSLVGLDRILLTQNAVRPLVTDPCFAQSAA